MPDGRESNGRTKAPAQSSQFSLKRSLLDHFDDMAQWKAYASGNAELQTSQDRGPHGGAMKLDFDFKGGGGFVVARREFSFPLPDAFALSFNVRGAALPNKFEFKLVDPSGKNVWRYFKDSFEFPTEWSRMLIRSRDIDFAWGPAGGGPITEIGAIEFAIAAGPGGQGTVWIDDVQFEDLSFSTIPGVTASSAVTGHEAGRAVDHRPESSWRSAPSAEPQWYLIDLMTERDFGGMIIDWDPAAPPRGFAVEISNDGVAWEPAYAAGRSSARRNYVSLPARTARYIRLNLTAADADKGVGIVNIEVKSYEFTRSINEFFHNIAMNEPCGRYPKYLRRQQTYWSPIGISNGAKRALLNQEGMVEVDEAGFSIEPFLWLDGKLITWADAAVTQHLEEQWLPIPSSKWSVDGLVFTTCAFATGAANDAMLWIRYRLENTGNKHCDLRLFAVVRPLQVTPPWQAFRNLGGVSPIREISCRDDAIWVNRTKAVAFVDRPAQFGAATFDEGIMSYVAAGEVPSSTDVDDGFGYASSALRYDLALEPGATRDVYLAVPFGERDPTRSELLPNGMRGDEEFEGCVRQWRSELAAVDIQLPGAGHTAVDALKTAAAHILINRDGPALHPGPRRYTRAWIRDGAIMGTALLRMGSKTAMRDFIRWYVQYQREDGFVPCCVDRDGPDWLVEHDSHGQLVYSVMEDFRFTGDRAFLAEMWPAVVKAIDYIEALRNSRLTPEFQTVEKRACYGLLPESASHEGYLAHPVHSYWDDFWALRGIEDAAIMAEILDEKSQAARFTALRDGLGASLYASIRTTIADRGLSYIPGSVEWADFDPTATANAISMLDESSNLPADAMDAMFREYFRGFRSKHAGEIDWTNYTAYEIRIIGALVRLGHRANALELLDFFLGDRRPLAWNQWPEISWRDPTSPGHLGDLPHTWIGAEYILSLMTMFAFEREKDHSLVIGAGLRSEWLDGEGGVQARNLPTWYGKLSFAMRRDNSGAVRLDLTGELTMPPGKIVIRPPLERPLREVRVNDRTTRTFSAEEAVIDQFPAEVVMS